MLCFRSSAAYLTDRKASREYNAKVFELIAEGVFKPVVYKEYPLSPAGLREAHKELAEGKTAGKCLVKVAA